ncbi:YqeG family HAD IIIA-type phosphatase [Aerococcaceae bacterium NML191219]|nr:YqeG family HAD IIIA-type phosphatase [Aerococcaceae bacterium NML191219]MDO4774562.1 YqeG family HAD IIIA-type phosphatase [Aerococcaceae bacterium]
MKRWIAPRWTLNNVFLLQPEMVLQQGYRAVIVDLDNTLVAWNCYEPTPEMLAWVQAMKDAGIAVYVLSNNTNARVQRVAQPAGVAYQANALKPRRKGFDAIVRDSNLPREQILVIGDQVITDIIGANRSGLDSVLVKPIAQHDNVYTWVNRSIERLLLKTMGIDRRGDWGNTLD